MANNTVGEVVDGAVAPLRSGLGGSSGLADQFGQLAQQLQQLQSVSQAAVEATQQNTQAVSLNSTVRTGSGGAGSTAGRITGAVESFLGIGTGLSPLITGLMGLFGGGSGQVEESPLAMVLMPPRTVVHAGVSEAPATEPFAVDYGQGGRARPVAGDGPAAVSAPQITVQVQAMDSRSFLDHSAEIAAAVRQAMLESSVLNDVVRGT